MSGTRERTEGLALFACATETSAGSNVFNSVEGIDIETMADGSICYVRDVDLSFRWKQDSVAAPSPSAVILPSQVDISEPGRWLLVTGSGGVGVSTWAATLAAGNLSGGAGDNPTLQGSDYLTSSAGNNLSIKTAQSDSIVLQTANGVPVSGGILLETGRSNDVAGSVEIAAGSAPNTAGKVTLRTDSASGKAGAIELLSGVGGSPSTTGGILLQVAAGTTSTGDLRMGTGTEPPDTNSGNVRVFTRSGSNIPAGSILMLTGNGAGPGSSLGKGGDFNVVTGMGGDGEGGGFNVVLGGGGGGAGAGGSFGLSAGDGGAGPGGRFSVYAGDAVAADMNGGVVSLYSGSSGTGYGGDIVLNALRSGDANKHGRILLKSLGQHLGIFTKYTDFDAAPVGAVLRKKDASTLEYASPVAQAAVAASIAPTDGQLTGVDITYVCDVSGGPITITLPSGCAPGTKVTIKDGFNGGTQAGTNNITVLRSSVDTIDGATSRVINTNLGVLRLYKGFGTDWSII